MRRRWGWCLVALAACAGPQRTPSEARSTGLQKLPERERALLEAYGQGGAAWESAREPALADRELTQFLVDNLVLEMLRAYDALATAGVRTEDPRAKQAFVRAQNELARIPKVASATLVELVRVGDGVAARVAGEALVAIGRPAVEPLLPLLDDRDERVRRRGAEICAALPHAAADEARVRQALIAAVLDDASWIVRAQATTALGARGARDRETKPWRLALERALVDRDVSVRECAARALAELGDPAAIPALANGLARAASQGELRALEACQQALRRLSGESRELKPQQWLDWWRDNRARIARREGQ